MKTGKMRISGRTVKIIRFGKGKNTGADLCLVRYYLGMAGDHTPYIVWGPKITVNAEDVIVK